MAVPLLIASGNLHKVREFRALLAGSEFDVLEPAEIGLQLEVEEAGRTYAENAAIKARAYASASGLASLADDSGVEVDALGGAPGVHSARFGDPGLTDAGRVALLLEQIHGTPTERRSARFRCVIVLSVPDGRIWEADGCCEGRIAEAPRGSNGFGYDPVFRVAGTDKTMAELSSPEKNQVSHRARAVAGLRAALSASGFDGPERVEATENHGDGDLGA